jgi:hypothetical protein
MLKVLPSTTTPVVSLVLAATWIASLQDMANPGASKVRFLIVQ